MLCSTCVRTQARSAMAPSGLFKQYCDMTRLLSAIFALLCMTLLASDLSLDSCLPVVTLAHTLTTLLPHVTEEGLELESQLKWRADMSRFEVRLGLKTDLFQSYRVLPDWREQGWGRVWQGGTIVELAEGVTLPLCQLEQEQLLSPSVLTALAFFLPLSPCRQWRLIGITYKFRLNFIS